MKQATVEQKAAAQARQRMTALVLVEARREVSAMTPAALLQYLKIDTYVSNGRQREDGPWRPAQSGIMPVADKVRQCK